MPRLRELVPCLFDDGEYIDCGEVEEALGLVNDDGAWYRADGVMRLAGLIEPPLQCPYYHSDRHYCSVHEEVQPIDRDALLALADEISSTSCDKVDGELTVDLIDVWGWAQAIREACGVICDD